MADGPEASPTPHEAAAAASIASPGDLHPAITAMIEGPRIEGLRVEASTAEAPKVESPPTQPEIAEPPVPLTAAISETIAAPATPAPDLTPANFAPAIDVTPAADIAPAAELTPIIVAKEPAAQTAPEAPKAESIRIEPRMPPATALAEPEPVAGLPPPFLREHTTRVIAAKPPVRPDANRADPRRADPDAARLKAAPPRPAPKAERAPRSGKFAVLAASVAICACLGSALGSVGIAALGHLPTATAPRADTIAEVRALRELVAQLGTDIAATRTNVEHLNRNSGSQFGKLVERFDKSDRAQVDPAAKLAKITETLDRLEKRVAQLPVTPPPAPTPVAATPPTNDVTGSVTPRPPEPKPAPKAQPQILETFVLRRVYDGVAVIEGRMGVIEVVPGQPLPGGGRVEDIRRQDGHWVVFTTKGQILAQRDR